METGKWKLEKNLKAMVLRSEPMTPNRPGDGGFIIDR
jgi:hypothetical protein